MKRVVSVLVLLGCGRTVSPTTADAGPFDSAVVRDAPLPADAPRPIVATPPRSRPASSPHYAPTSAPDTTTT